MVIVAFSLLHNDTQLEKQVSLSESGVRFPNADPRILVPFYW